MSTLNSWALADGIDRVLLKPGDPNDFVFATWAGRLDTCTDYNSHLPPAPSLCTSTAPSKHSDHMTIDTSRDASQAERGPITTPKQEVMSSDNSFGHDSALFPLHLAHVHVV